MAGALTAAIAAIFSGSAVTADPYYEYTTLLLPGSGTNGAQNNTFLDGSTNNFAITRNGNTTQGTFSPFSQTGWGNYFDGASDYLNIASNAAFSFGTGSFTYETWFYSTGTTSAANVFYDLSNANGAGSFAVFSTGGILYVRIGGTGNDLTYTLTSSWVNTWHHLAVVRNGSTLTIYLDGTSVASGTRAQDVTQSTPYIGDSINALSGYSFAGYLSNTRVVKGAAVYTGAFTPPTSPLTAISGTSLLTCQSNRFIDNSTNNFTITRNGDTKVVAFSPFNPTASWSAATYGGSGYFDGSGDYLSASANTAFAFGTGEWTMECWVYASAIDVSTVFFSCGTNGTQFGTNSSGNLAIAQTGVAFEVNSSTALPLNQWNHVAAVRNASNSTSIFLNGTRIANGTLTTNYSSSGTAYVNYNPNNIGSDFTGYLSNLRIVKGTAVYDPTQTTNTVPTAPLTAITNTSLLLNFTNAGIYDATSKNDLETVGDAQISNTTAKWGSTSIKFDGTGDWLLDQSPIPPTTFGSGDFSIEMWIYATTSGTQRWLIDGRIATPADGAYPAIYISSGNVLVYYVSAAARITGTTTVTTNTWHFVQVIRTSGTTKMYLNGTQEGSNYTDSTVYVNPGVARPIIGAATNLVQPFTGYIQDLRITTGYARPTTVPTAAFPTL